MLLEGLLASMPVRALKTAIRTLNPGARTSSSRKADLLDVLMRLLDGDSAMHEKTCRYVLATTQPTKAHIDMLIRVFGAHSAATKAESIAAFIRLDAATRRPGGADRQSADNDGTAEHQLVPYDPVEVEKVADQLVIWRRRPRLQRMLWRGWKKATQKAARKAQRKSDSRAIISAIDTVLEQSSPCLSLISFQKDVARAAKVQLDSEAALVFFHRRLKMAFRKLPRKHPIARMPKRKKHPKRTLPNFVVHAGDGRHFEHEKRAMWENDTWPKKHAMLDNPLIRSHRNKLAKREAAQQDAQPGTPESDGLYG